MALRLMALLMMALLTMAGASDSYGRGGEEGRSGGGGVGSFKT